MTHHFMRSLTLGAMLAVVSASAAAAQDCSSTIPADEAMQAETARYAAQTTSSVKRPS